MKQAESSTGGTPSDAELILQVRSGDRDAFGVLYERHAAAARALARQYVSSADAEDVVADAFSKLFEMLRRGAGPDAGFRPYLYTVVRHRAFDVSRGAARIRPTTDDEIESVLGRVASEEDPALAGFERSVVSKAYFDLPERWREVLWYVLVDDLKPAQVAPVLGLSPNGVSALLYRAKEALRAGYLQQHLTHAPSDTCRSVNPLLGGYVRESLSKRETTKISEHLATCGTCSALVLELHDVAHGMKTVIAPLVLGAGGLALVGAGAPIGGLVVAAKAGAGAGAAAGAPAATVGVTAASAGGFSGAVSSAVSVTAGALVSAAASATGGSVAAGALAVAAVSMVAVLQIAGPPELKPLAADTVITTTDGRELPGSEEIDNGKPVLPTDVEPGDADTRNYLVVDYGDAAEPLAARQPQDLLLAVTNTGDEPATGTQLEITLPAGLTVAQAEGPFGTGVGGRLVPASVETPPDSAGEGTQDGSTQQEATSSPDTASGAETGEAATEPTSSPSAPSTVAPMAGDGPSACTPTEKTNVLLCSLGELAPGQKHGVTVRVQANSGGDYPVGTEVWADGMVHAGLTLPGRTVAPFGPELSAATADVSLSSPGVASLPVRVASTGDRAVPASAWAVDVTLPAGVTPASWQPELSCTPGELNTWRCVPLPGTDAAAVELAPQSTVDVALNITTAAEATSSQATVLGAANVRPVLDGNAHSASATLVVTSAWADAADGVGATAASCEAVGGVAVADAIITGNYTNTTQRAVHVTLEAAGSKASSGKALAPGESTTLTVHDGLRAPAGQATFVLTTDVDGRVYETRVPAGEHDRTGCYAPEWTTSTDVRTISMGATVALEGSVTNTSDETMTAVMLAPVNGTTLESVSRPVSPGGTVTLTVDTGQTHLAEGAVTFRLSRDGVDTDGDLSSRAVVPETDPKAHYAAASIAPAVGADEPAAVGVCEFDVAQDRSVQTFEVTADNTGSTMPVLFQVNGVSKTVPAGATQRIEYPVTWGTGTVDLTAVGKTLATIEVPFESCAELAWPAENVSVATATECVEWRVRLTAAVENRTGRDWMGVLVREGSGEVGAEQQVGAGTTVLDLTRETPVSGEGNVTVRLTRELEGQSFTVEKSFGGAFESCVDDAVCEPTSAPTASPVATDPAADEGRRPPPWLPGYCDD